MFGDEPASWGELVSVTCSVAKGDQPLEISWAFNGTPIGSNHGSDVVVASTNKKNSVLTIESVAARHAGEYTCSASNRAGATSHSAQLTVNGTCVDYSVYPRLTSLCPRIDGAPIVLNIKRIRVLTTAAPFPSVLGVPSRVLFY